MNSKSGARETPRREDPDSGCCQPRHRARRAPGSVADRIITFAEIVGKKASSPGSDCRLPKRHRDPQKECPRKATRSSSRAFCVSRRNSGGKLPRRMMRAKFWACISNGAKVNRLEGNARQLLRLGRDLPIIGARSLLLTPGLFLYYSL